MADGPGVADALRAKVVDSPSDEAAEWRRTVADVLPRMAGQAALSGSCPVKSKHFDRAAASAAKGSAQGFGGWRSEHIQAVRGGDKQAWSLLCSFGLMTVLGLAPANWYDFIRHVKLIPFHKSHAVPDPSLPPDPRPVGCTDPLWRWASRALLLACREPASRFLGDRQLAVSVSAGAEAIGKFVEASLDGTAEDAWLT